jgi:hypothetical protein
VSAGPLQKGREADFGYDPEKFSPHTTSIQCLRKVVAINPARMMNRRALSKELDTAVRGGSGSQTYRFLETCSFGSTN